MVPADVPIPVRDALDRIARQTGTDRSTVLSDLACCAVGKPELARLLRFAPHHGRPGMVAKNNEAGGLGVLHTVTSRVPIPVRDALDEIVQITGAPRTTVLADLACCAVGLPEYARLLRFDPQTFRLITGGEAAQEVLPLAI